MNFSFRIDRNGKADVIALEGMLTDKSQATELFASVDKLLAENRNRFIISLENSKYMNSTGLNILINILTKARKSGGEVVVCNVPQKINELLLITKLNTVFTVTPSLDEAMSKIEA